AALRPPLAVLRLVQRGAVDRAEGRAEAVVCPEVLELPRQLGGGALGEGIDESLAVAEVVARAREVRVRGQRAHRLEDRALLRAEGLVLDVAHEPPLVGVGGLGRALN